MTPPAVLTVAKVKAARPKVPVCVSVHADITWDDSIAPKAGRVRVFCCVWRGSGTVSLDPLPGELLGESVTNQSKHTGITGIARQQGKASQPTTHSTR